LFKVGWLLTKRLRATTALYYTFFLPGVLLHQVVYWLAAGLLNVRAERSIEWPQAQEVAELRLHFVQLAKDTGPVKLAFINLAPLTAGIIAVYFITNNILRLQTFAAMLRDGSFPDLPAAVTFLTSTPDFWLWVYIAFTIANTMLPRWQDVKGLRVVGAIIAITVVALFLIGVVDELLLGTLARPLVEGLNALAGVFTAIIGIDLLMVALLGSVESLIERVTGHSATFKNGKLITFTREELRQQREQEQARKARERARRAEMPAGPPSVYNLPFPIPEGPSRDSSQHEPIIVRKEEEVAAPRLGLGPSPRPVMAAGRPPEQRSLASGSLPGRLAGEEQPPEQRPDEQKSPPAPADADTGGDEADEVDGITREPPEEPA